MIDKGFDLREVGYFMGGEVTRLLLDGESTKFFMFSRPPPIPEREIFQFG
jgi:hypothetical protein